MVKLVVLYGQPEDPAAFEDYYSTSHIPLAAKIPDVKRFEASRGAGTPDGGESPYFRMAELWYEDEDALRGSMASDAGQAAVNDIPKFATGGATVFVAAVD
ncbi:MAG: hypothetical protein QOF83_749 [Solirubrobacteraceae bacterium]|nr:hypothetical protein [Solirubrobacteraceae bacterium]